VDPIAARGRALNPSSLAGTSQESTLRWFVDLFRRPSTHATPTGRRARRRHLRPQFERLEDRTVPTLVFTPQFGAETQTHSGGGPGGNPVYFIFTGPGWSATSPTVQQYIRAAKNLMSSAYFSGIQQYGGSRPPTYGGAVYSSDDTVQNGFGWNDINHLVHDEAGSNGLPDPDDDGPTPIYVVVTPPGWRSDLAGALGFNQRYSGVITDADPASEIWVNGDNVDSFTWSLGHELAEIITDLDGGGVEVNPGPQWILQPPETAPNQIGDFEGNTYAYRNSNGVVVQPYWGRDTHLQPNDGGNWIGPDGAGAVDNSPLFVVTPIWTFDTPTNTYTFTNAYSVTIRGDQAAQGQANDLTIDTTAGGKLLEVILNGQTQVFNLGREAIDVDGQLGPKGLNEFFAGTITDINVDLGGSDNTITVQDTPKNVPLTIEDTGADTVTIANTHSPVTIYDSGGSTIQVYGNHKRVTIWSVAGGSNVTVGDGTVAAIRAEVDLTSSHRASTLTVDDFHDTASPTATLGWSTSSDFEGTGYMALTGLAAGHILYDGSSVSPTIKMGSGSLTVRTTGRLDSEIVIKGGDVFLLGTGGSVLVKTGAGRSLVSVVNSSNLVTIDTGTGSALIFVARTGVYPVVMNLGSGQATVEVGAGTELLRDLNSEVVINGGKSQDTLIVDDQLNRDPADYTVTAVSVVSDTSAIIFDAGVGNVQLNGGSGFNRLTFDDSASSFSFLTTYTLVGGNVTRTGVNVPRGGFYPTSTLSLSYNHVAALTVDGARGGAEFDVQGIAAGTPVTINANGGNNTVNVGDAADTLGGLGDDLSVFGVSTDAVILNDQGTADTTSSRHRLAYTVDGSFVTRTDSVSRRLGFRWFQYPPVSRTVFYTGVGKVMVNGSTTDKNSFTVQSTASGTPVTLNAGNAGDQFNVGDANNNLDFFAGTLTLLGGTGVDTVTVNDQADLDSGSPPRLVYDLRNQVQLPGGETLSRTDTNPNALPGADIEFGNIDNLVLNASPYGNEIDVESTRAATPVTVYAGAGTDTVNVGGGGDRIGAIQGGLTVYGHGQSTTLDVNDSGTLTAENYTVYADHLQRSIITGGVYQYNTAAIGYHQVGNVVVQVGQDRTGQNQGGLYNTLDVMSTAPGTDTSLYGNASGQTQFAVYPWDGPPSYQIRGPVHFHAGSGGLDTVVYYDYFDPSPATFNLTAGQIAGPSFATVTYDGPFYSAGVTTSAYAHGGSHVNVLSSSPTWTVVQANAGDTVTVGSQAPAVGAGTLAGLGGNLTIGTVGPSQAATVILDDAGDAQAGKQVTFNNDGYAWGVSGLSPHRIYFALGTGSTAQVLGGSGGNTYDIQSTPAGTALTVNAGSGTDTINVGGATAQTLDSILGAVTVTGRGANTTLNYNDLNTTAANYYWYYVNANNLSRKQVFFTSSGQTYSPLEATVNFGAIGTLNVHGHNASAAAGSGYWWVSGTTQGTTTNLDAGTGVNEFFVAGNNYVLDSIQGPLFLHGSGSGYPNDNLVYVNDELDPKPQRFLLSTPPGGISESGMVQRFAPGSSQPNMATITYDGMNAYAVLVTANEYSPSRSHNATVDIQGNAADLWTILAVGTGDTVNVGTPAHTMDGISGDLRIQAAAGQTPAVTFDDSGDTANRTIDLADEGPGSGYRVTGLLAPGNPVRGRIWLLDPAENVTIKTGSGNDLFRAHDFNEAPALTIDGGGGLNTLDYSAYQGDVRVDLPHGFATGFTSVANIENLVGSQGNNLLVGISRTTSLVGGTGRNVLIGGGGNATLDASRSSGDNILIGGTTAYGQQMGATDALNALNALFSEWTRTDLGFDDRMSDLSNGFNSKGATPLNRVNGLPILLNEGTVTADSSPDTMTGGAGQNWFFVDQDDNVTNYLPGRDRKTIIQGRRP
jgi:hypothetical protein